VVLGSSMGDFATNLWDPAMVPAGPFIQVDANAKVIGRSMPITQGVIAELSAFIPALATAMQELTPDAVTVEQRWAYLIWMKETNSAYADSAARESDATPIRPERAMAIVSEMLPAGSHIFPDAGNTCGWSAHYLELDPPTRMHAALDVGAMGYATAAIVGAKMAAPDATCLSIGGDGSFLMHGAEITTAKQYGVGPIWMVWNENDLNMVTQSMAANFPAPGWDDYYALGNPDLVKVAEGFGADAYLVHSPSDLRDALARAIRGGQEGRPQVIVVREDSSARPPFVFPAKVKT
jgi:acetolactate synthase-1/2/3 large subunit